MGKTLCDWSKKDIERHFEALCRLTADPRYTCRKCARSAHASDSLCKPRRRVATDAETEREEEVKDVP